MADRPTNCYYLCPAGYSGLLSNNFGPMKDWDGYDEDMDDELWLEDYEMTLSQVNQIVSNLKPWNDVIPSSYGTSDAYVIPADLVDEIADWGGTIFMNTAGDAFCDGVGYDVFLLSTEGWGMM